MQIKILGLTINVIGTTSFDLFQVTAEADPDMPDPLSNDRTFCENFKNAYWQVETSKIE